MKTVLIFSSGLLISEGIAAKNSDIARTQTLIPRAIAIITPDEHSSECLSRNGMNIFSRIIASIAGAPPESERAILVPITYADLKALRDSEQLVPGTWYRITDYVTTVANDAEARSAGHLWHKAALLTVM